MQAVSANVRWSATAAVPDPALTVRDILAEDDVALDYAGAKLAFDQLIDPSQDAAETFALIDRMADTARRLAGPAASPDARMAAVRRLLYVAGPWNDGRPFAYDHDDPAGQSTAGKLLATYLATRRGNCVSMPALFMILADRLGLDVAFATAPLHVFVRYRSDRGQIVNIETTSGAHPARDAWYREQMPMSDRAVDSGLYLRSLSKREGVALLATTVLEHLIEQGRFHGALGVSEAILRHAPRDAYTMVKQGSVCAELIQRSFKDRYRDPMTIPSRRRAECAALADRNATMFKAAEALGWEPVA